jgi:CheY-like chemotaxis protein
MNKQILIVDDNTPIRELVRRWIIRAGYLALEAKTGEEGILLAEKHHPDLIIMDGHLPIENGIDITRRLKNSSLTKDIPILAMTIDSSLQKRFMDAGASGFTVKPVRCNEFIRIMERYLTAFSKTEAPSS